MSMFSTFHGDMTMREMLSLSETLQPKKAKEPPAKKVHIEWYAGYVRDGFMKLKRDEIVFIRPAPQFNQSRYGKCWTVLTQDYRYCLNLSENAFGVGLNQLITYITDRGHLKKASKEDQDILEHTLAGLLKTKRFSHEPIDKRLV